MAKRIKKIINIINPMLYKAHLKQSGSGAPTANVFVNEISAGNWERPQGDGAYRLPFTVTDPTKVFLPQTGGFNGSAAPSIPILENNVIIGWYQQYVSDDGVWINIQNTSNSLVDLSTLIGEDGEIPVSIEVYP